MSAAEQLHGQSSSGGPGSRVLVAYATRFGSTRGIAERIATTLQRGGHTVELCACEDVEDAGIYRAVVVGSAVFNQRWLPEADHFVRRNLQALSSHPVWLFTVGSFGDTKTLIGPLMRREPANIEELIHTIGPREYRVFAGVIERHQWPFPSRLFYHALSGRFGDHRDWAAIEHWANGIAAVLQHSTPALDS